MLKSYNDWSSLSPPKLSKGSFCGWIIMRQEAFVLGFTADLWWNTKQCNFLVHHLLWKEGVAPSHCRVLLPLASLLAGGREGSHDGLWLFSDWRRLWVVGFGEWPFPLSRAHPPLQKALGFHSRFSGYWGDPRGWTYRSPPSEGLSLLCDLSGVVARGIESVGWVKNLNLEDGRQGKIYGRELDPVWTQMLPTAWDQLIEPDSFLLSFGRTITLYPLFLRLWATWT